MNITDFYKILIILAFIISPSSSLLAKKLRKNKHVPKQYHQENRLYDHNKRKVVTGKENAKLKKNKPKQNKSAPQVEPETKPVESETPSEASSSTPSIV